MVRTSFSCIRRMRSRPFSAYSNLCEIEENDEIVESELGYWHSKSEENEEFEVIEIRKEVGHPGGLAFRIIGSRTSGIFVSYVDETSQQARQMIKVASIINEGDLIKECNGRSMSGYTCYQAASILRHTLSNFGKLRLQISRRSCGSLLMSKRRCHIVNGI
ncbi:hypothetical protein DICVIV_11257 [Dictyocaulus viviparus]|uniref:PDZ domain-containing protein n=1 Tax=Dictyocaulus viviparus TaxID=29172 RepID=A0A0D8XG89_DICVI|nr:hypothetical protein DICVIV_11257 [Dictyocaulus viviparus]